MVRLELTAEEAAELREILMEYLSDLRTEIADTDTSSFKDNLRQEKAVVSRVLAQLVEQLAPKQ